jgi:sialic acid synthase SpsE/sugar phosphate isomerase/epimerase/CBS domain-containing protein
MYIDKSLNKYSINIKSNIKDTLDKYRYEKSRLLVVVDDLMNLSGVISNGDIVNWILNGNNDKSASVSSLYNENYFSLNISASLSEISNSLREYHTIPLVDDAGKLIGIARDVAEETITISDCTISNESNVFIISEIGINHNGSLDSAKELIKQSYECGANAVKLQVRDLDSLYTKSVLNDSLKAEHGTQYLLNELKKSELPSNYLKELCDYSQQIGIVLIGTPFDLKSIDLLEQVGIPAYKIGSPDFTNIPLIEKVAGLGKPMIISTGMSTEHEIQAVIEKLNKWGVDYALLHCNSTYPASIVDLNLKYINKLKTLSNRVVGYSGHERGYLPTLAAVSMGAKIIERHFTLDNNAEGPDHSSSLEPDDFRKMVFDIRQIEDALGDEKRIFNQGEQVNRIALGKSLVFARNMELGEEITQTDLVCKTPAKGVSPLELENFIGKVLNKGVLKDDYIHFEDISILEHNSTSFDIDKNWGIVGRLNDFEDYLEWKPKLVEIHLTWRDLTQFNLEDLENRFNLYDQDLVVHAPEYYKDKLIDFATRDTNTLDYSIEMLTKTIELAKSLGSKFKGVCRSKGPKVVVHPGGHFESRLETNKADQYKALSNNLTNIKKDGVELLVENMPPNPWYFGGQWYNTVFMDSNEIRQFIDETKLGFCYDTSHALLYCNSINQSLSEYTKNIQSLTRHLHIADAVGTTQEGLQIGEGNIDFDHLFEILNSVDSGFIPEIWQGHLNNGKGFCKALHKIEKILKDKMSTRGCSSNSH